ncbi:MAG: hypothetical protein ACK4M7_10320, partial [Burkholderiales bacterium]
MLKPFIHTIFSLFLLVMAALSLMALIVWLWHSTPSGQAVLLHLIEKHALQTLQPTLHYEELGGKLPFEITFKKLSLRDETSVWLEANHGYVSISPLSLLYGTLTIKNLSAETIALHRLPQSTRSSTKPPIQLIPLHRIILANINVTHLELGKALTGLKSFSAKLSGKLTTRFNISQMDSSAEITTWLHPVKHASIPSALLSIPLNWNISLHYDIEKARLLVNQLQLKSAPLHAETQLDIKLKNKTISGNATLAATSLKA